MQFFVKQGETKKQNPPIPLYLKILLLLTGTGLFLCLNLILGGFGEYTLLNVLMLAVIFAAVLIRIRLPEVLSDICSYLILAVIPGLHFYLLELLQQHSREMYPKMIWLNLGFYYAAFLLIFFLFYKKSGWAVFACSILCMTAAIVNSCGWIYRSTPVLPWDLYSAGVALSVSGNYTYPFTHLFWTVMLAFITLMVLAFRFPVRHYAKHFIHIPVTAVSAGLLAALVLFFQTDGIFTNFGGYRYLFTPSVYYERNGTAVGFLSTLRYLDIEKPAGYQIQALTDKASQYSAEAEKEQAELRNKVSLSENATDVLPNIIVIMNEAFSDLRPLADYTTNIPVTPFLDSLTENTVRGSLFVSVKGGNTANTEYEFLTGGTMAFLPAGAIPYQQYIKSETPSLATQLRSLGYTAQAVHPYYANGWCRDTVYPALGFEKAVFYEDLKPFYTSQVLRSYYSDKTLFRYLIDQYEEKEPGTPLFQFAVTMQNHGSYDQEYDNFIPDVTVDGISQYDEKIQKRLSAYLSLIRRTDEAFEMLVDYFSEADEKTVIVMFGDHQPNDSVVYPLLSLVGKKNTAENLDDHNRYITPFVIWANYDIEEKEIEEISANYLSSVLCETAGIPLTGYQRFLESVYDAFPVVTARTVSENGTLSGPERVSALLHDPSSLLTDYRAFSYNQIFDTKHRLPGFFD